MFDEINALSKSDHVKLVDCNKRSSSGKYRHDENVLSGFVPISRQISVPCKAEKEYVTGKLRISVTLVNMINKLNRDPCPILYVELKNVI